MTRPSPAELMREAPRVRRTVRRLGVPERDADDVTAEVLSGAWFSIVAGRYVPSPSKPPVRALRAWLVGVAFNLVGHYRDRARVRHEELTLDGSDLARWLAAPEEDEPGALLAEREDLAAVLDVARAVVRRIRPARDAEVVRAWLEAVAVGGEASFPELAAKLGRPVSSAYKALARFRELAAAALAENAPPRGAR